MITELEKFITDIGDIANGSDITELDNLDRLAYERVAKLAEHPRESAGYAEDSRYCRGLLDGIALRHILGQCNGGGNQHESGIGKM